MSGTTWSGIAFLVFYIASSVFLGEMFGGVGDSDAFFVEYYDVESHRIGDMIGGHLLVGAGLVLLLFVAHLVNWMRATIGRSVTLDAALMTGTLAGGMLLVGAASLATVPFSKWLGEVFSDEPLTSAAVSVPPQLGYLLVFMSATWAMAFTIGLVTYAAWSAGVWPRWLRVFSVVTATLLLFSAVGFMPIVLLPVWVGVVSFWARGATVVPVPVRVAPVG